VSARIDNDLHNLVSQIGRVSTSAAALIKNLVP